MTASPTYHSAAFATRGTDTPWETSMTANIATFPVRVPADRSLEDRLDVVTYLLDELAEGVHALLTEAPRTARRIDEVEGKVDGLIAGLSEVLAATQAIAAKLDASAEADQ
jgi:hypothetical protein